MAGESSPAYQFRLFIAGLSPRSTRAVSNAKQLLEHILGEGYALEIVDVSCHPDWALREGLIALPTLVRVQPPPTKRLVGDLDGAEAQIRRILIEGTEADPASKAVP